MAFFYIGFLSFLLHCDCIATILFSLLNGATGKVTVPCYFVFGDSLSDNGNNNGLNTKAKVNFRPYGIDFPEGPTGRFTNGRIMHDFIGDVFGIKRIPPFANSKGQNILQGVNYASGSAGILDETGENLGQRVPLTQQIKNHKTIISRLTGQGKGSSLPLNRCIYAIQIGSNDYINNYFHPHYKHIRLHDSLENYTTRLIDQLSQQLQILYNDGARKFAVYGMAMIGCAPYTIMAYATNKSDCAHNLNKGSQRFNDKLGNLIHHLNNKMKDATFTYINPVGYAYNLSSFVQTPCCKFGGGGGELCLPNSTPCKDRNRYIFWDGVHVTEALHKIAFKVSYSTKDRREAFPYNIQQLANK